MKCVSHLTLLVLLCGAKPVWAQSTTFRVTTVQDIGGGKVKVDLALQQGARAAPIDVWVNTKLPAHRNWVHYGDRGPAVESGMHLGQVPQQLAARQNKVQSYELELGTLQRKLGVGPGDTLYFSIKLPSTYNGGHEWGVNGGSSYSTGTSCQIPSSCKIERGAKPGTKARARQASVCLNVNSATPAQLEVLPGIGRSLAARIVTQRKTQGRFGSVSDLTRVKGIGPQQLRRLTPMVKVSGRSSGLARSTARRARP